LRQTSYSDGFLAGIVVEPHAKGQGLVHVAFLARSYDKRRRRARNRRAIAHRHHVSWLLADVSARIVAGRQKREPDEGDCCQEVEDERKKNRTTTARCVTARS